MMNRIKKAQTLWLSLALLLAIPTHAQVQLHSEALITKAQLERQVLGKDVMVWEQATTSTGKTIIIPAAACRPGAYTLSFVSGDQPLTATILLEKGELTVTLKPLPNAGQQVLFAGADGVQNTAYDAWKEQEHALENDYYRYQQLTAAYTVPSNFRREVDDWWAQRRNTWDSYKSKLISQWSGHALASVVRSTWGNYYNAWPAGIRQQLPGTLPPLTTLTYNANLVEGKDLEYLRLLFTNPAKNTEELTDTLLAYLPRLLDKALGNDSLTQYWGYNLRKEMSSADLDEVQELIDTRYLANACSSDNDKDLQQRLAAYKNTRRGQVAPNIRTVGFELYKTVPADTTLVIFWASWCPHCSDELPLLYKAMLQQRHIKVVAVALDESEPAWLHAKAQYPDWYHVRAPKKWDDANVLPYGVYATPTLFLLDPDKKVIRKYNTVKDFLRK